MMIWESQNCWRFTSITRIFEKKITCLKKKDKKVFGFLLKIISLRIKMVKLVYTIMSTRLFVMAALMFAMFSIEASAAGKCKGKCRDGKGTYTFENGEVYSGTFKEGKFEGKGTYTFVSGSKYEGEYKNGVREGKGKFTYPTGDVYEGDFVGGYPEGKGVYYYSSGDRYEGEYKGGKKNGNGVYYFSSGTVQTGVFEEGELVEEISIKRPPKKRF
jgi:hypothetical protein